MSTIDETKQFIPLNIAVLTISDTRALADDKSGTTLSERIVAAGHKLAAREIIVDMSKRSAALSKNGLPIQPLTLSSPRAGPASPAAT